MGRFINFNKLDKFMLVGSVLMIGVATFSLFGNSVFPDTWSSQGTAQITDDTNPNEVAGKTEKTLNDIKRKAKGSLSWDPLDEKSLVFYNESVYSGNDSEVILRTEAGTALYLEPNSLVYFEKDNDQMNIDIKLGGLQAELQKGESFVLKNGEALTKLEADANQTKFRLQKNNKQQSEIVLQSGQGRAIYDGHERLLRENRKLTIDPEKKTARISPFAVVLKSPLAGEKFNLKPDLQTTFEWEAGPRETSFDLVVSRKRNYADPVFKTTTPQKRIEVPKLQTGAYFWKVSTSNDKEGSEGTFWIKRQLPPVLTYPVHQSIVSKTTARLAWQNPGQAKNLRLQVARDPQMTQIVLSEKTNELDYTIENLESTAYYWRVITEDPEYNVSSQVSSFLVQPQVATTLTPQQKKVEQAQAVLEEQKFREQLFKAHELKIIEEARIQKAKEEAARPKIPVVAKLAQPNKTSTLRWNSTTKVFDEPMSFSWSRVALAEKYIFKLTTEQDRQFQNPLVSETLAGTKYDWMQVAPGNYIWTVTPVSSNPQARPSTTKGQVSLSLENPDFQIPDLIKCPPMPDNCSDAEFIVNTAVPPDYKIQIEISQMADFKAVSQTLKVTDPQGTIKDLSEGSFFARAVFLNKNDKTASSYSAVRSFKLNRDNAPVLDAPKLTSPQNGTSLVLLEGKMSPLVFQWGAVNKAENYVLQFSLTSNFEKIAMEKTVKGVNLILRQKPVSTSNTFFWRVKAAAKYHGSTWSDVRSFQFEK